MILKTQDLDRYINTNSLFLFHGVNDGFKEEVIKKLTQELEDANNKIQSINKGLDTTIKKQLEELESLKDKTDRNNLFQRTFIAQIIQELKLLLEFSRDPQMIEIQFNYFYEHINQLIDLAIRVTRQKNEHRLPVKLYLVSLNQIMNELIPVFKIMASKNSNIIKFNINGNLLFLSKDL